MQTKINVLKFAKELRDRMKELQAKHKKDLAKYNKDVASWKISMAAWCRAEGPKRVERITLKELADRQGRYGRDSMGIDVDTFFAGAPRPPRRPETEQINLIRSTLRHLAITGRDTVSLDTSEVGKLLGERGSEDDD